MTSSSFHKRRAKNEFCGGSSNNSVDYEIEVVSKKNHNKNSVVKFESFGHNSFEYWIYLSNPCPWVTIHVKVIGNFLSLEIIFLHTCSLGSAIFTWSILSWITHRNSSFDQTMFSMYDINFYMTIVVRCVFLASLHTQLHCCYAFPIWILNPWRIHKQ